MDNIKVGIGHVNLDAPLSNTRSWKDFADLINCAWRKGPQAFIEAGQYLIEAKEELDRDQYTSLLKFEIAFSESTAKKLVGIARNRVLSSHVNQLPACYSTLYVLSQIDDEVLETAIAAGKVHPGMQRKDAVALRKPPQTEQRSENPFQSRSKSSFAAAWDAALATERGREEITAKLDQVGRDGLCQVLSEALKSELRDAILAQTIQTGSTSSFAVKATNHLHCAMRCAEQPDPGEQDVKTMMGALHCIGRDADRKGLARSKIVIVEAGPKRRK